MTTQQVEITRRIDDCFHRRNFLAKDNDDQTYARIYCSLRNV